MVRMVRICLEDNFKTFVDFLIFFIKLFDHFPLNKKNTERTSIFSSTHCLSKL